MVAALSSAIQNRISKEVIKTYKENFGSLYEKVHGVSQDSLLNLITAEYNRVSDYTSKEVYDKLFALMNALYLEEQATIDTIKTLGIDVVSKAKESSLNIDVGARVVSRQELLAAKRGLMECKTLCTKVSVLLKELSDPKLKRLESLITGLTRLLQTRSYKLNTLDTVMSQALAKQLDNLVPKIQEEASASLMESVTASVWDALLGRGTSSRKVTTTKDSGTVSKTAKKPNTPLRSVTGQFYSLVSLKDFINNNLTKAVIENMGNGNRKDILNFRTGRLAVSAFVEGLVKNRDGAVVAYYTYLKDPYATFAPGGAQSSPPSRDPARLIDRSIREVAKSKVANRLRTVLV